MNVLTPREAAIFACLADTVLAPAPPLPPIEETDAIEAFDAWLALSPRPNRIALRAVLLLLGRRWRHVPHAERLASLREVERGPLPGARQLVEALRSATALAYYGDRGVQRRLGYTP